MKTAQQTGQDGEAMAARLAKRRGWQQVRTNVRIGRGEADLVAEREVDGKKAVLIAEVKSSRVGDPAPERLGKRQMARLWRMAGHLAERGASQVEVALVLVTIQQNQWQIRWLALDPF